jgi:hypothetical protein
MTSERVDQEEWPYRIVRLTARASGLLFAASEATDAFGAPARPVARRLYVAFAAAHGVHFVAVTRYAAITGGRNLFPGGRHLGDVGGWPTVLPIYGLFVGLVALGGVNFTTYQPPRRAITVAGHVATELIGALFIGTYLGQTARSPWFAVPAATIGASVAARLFSVLRRHR